jgi:hypothetical protein
MAKLYNLARMSTATSGTGTITLGSAVSGYLSFAGAGVANGEIVRYGIKDGSNSEVGYGTYTSAGTTLTRTVKTSTNSNNAINLSGSAEVFITPLAEDFLHIVPPQGRLTLATGTPVMTSTQSAKTTIYYTPYVGRLVPLYDGTSFNMHDIGGELSQATTDATKSPGSVGTVSNYDLFVWLDSGTYRCTRGPSWSSDTSRGAGAGTTELTMVNGIYLNANAITNGPGASRGTYVGTVRSNGSSQIDYIFGDAAAGGTAGFFGVWNAYNRRSVATMVRDTADTWTYSTANTWRAADNSSTARVSFVRGLDEDSVVAQYHASGTAGASTAMVAGIGLDSTTAFSGTTWLNNVPSTTAGGTARYSGLPGIGFHYVSAIEFNTTTTASTWHGDLGVAYFQTGLHVELLN